MRRPGMKMALTLTLAAALGVAGCTDTLQNDPYARGLAPGDGSLALPADTVAALHPVSAEVATMPGRLEERYRFPSGFVEFERVEGGSYFAERVSGASYRALFLGVTVAAAAVPAHVLEPRRAGPVAYAPVVVGGQPCLSFRRAMGAKVELGRAALAVGVLCRPVGDDIPETEFLDQALAFAKTLKPR